MKNPTRHSLFSCSIAAALTLPLAGTVMAQCDASSHDSGRSGRAVAASNVSMGAIAASSSDSNDLVDVAISAGSFKTLAAALEAADLIETLKGDGPFTVFAPTDDAFAKLPAGTVESLLKPENRDQLTRILTYHVVSGRVPAGTIVSMSFAETLSGQRVDIRTTNGVMVDNANVIKTDIEADNGIIHVIDTVLMPSNDDIVDTAVGAGSFKTLAAAVKAANLLDTLKGDGPFTVFAPTDEAFAKLPAGTVESLLKPQNRQQLIDILTYHVVSGRVYSDQAIKLSSATTLQKSDVRVSFTEGRLRINDSNVVQNDIETSNGVIHVIDQVLLPSVTNSAEDTRTSGRKLIGIYNERPSQALASQLGIDRDAAQLITGFVSNARAERAGLQKFDVITAVNGVPATSENLAQEKAKTRVGDAVRLTIRRGGERLTIDVPLTLDEHK